ncbi:MAG: alpha/beta hydrolase [Aeromicrobium sp.]|uniref:alpha/beta fold hydrolase n=1 Tax=Aeromicrobium sp. TaxID=1871063 RepID=UPI0039E5613C
MTERMIDVGAVELCVETFGDPRDPAVLLIHGAQASMLWWEEGLCEAVAAGGRFVIRYDQRDTGRSTACPPGRPDYAMSDLAADAAGVLDALGVDHAHVVGRSMGGGAALFLAVDHPERVATVTLVTTTSGADDLPPPDPEFTSLPPLPDDADRAALIDHVTASVAALSGRSPHLDVEAVRARATRDVDRARDSRASLTNHWMMTFDAPRGGGWGEITVPTLVVEGALDPCFPPPHGASLVAAIPDARLLTFDDVGHDLPPAAWPAFIPALLRHTAQA